MNKNSLLLSQTDLDRMFGQKKQNNKRSHRGGTGYEVTPVPPVESFGFPRVGTNDQSLNQDNEQPKSNIVTGEMLDQLMGNELPERQNTSTVVPEFSATSNEPPVRQNTSTVLPEFSATSDEPVGHADLNTVLMNTSQPFDPVPTTKPQINTMLSETSDDGFSAALADLPSTTIAIHRPAPTVPSAPMLAYHIVLDSEFGLRNKLGKSLQVFGKLRNTINEKQMPVLFDESESARVAGRLIDKVIEMGTIGNKKYPVAGAVILGLSLNGVNKIESNVNSSTGLRNYDNINVDNELSVYTINGQQRGVLNKSVFEVGKATVVSAKYVVKTTLDKHAVFALHNVNPDLTADDIRLLSKLYNSREQFIPLNVQAQTGGNDINHYYAQYRKEKAQYLELKKIAKQRGLI